MTKANSQRLRAARRAAERFQAGLMPHERQVVLDSMDDPVKRAAERRAQRFQSELARKVRHYRPEQFVWALARQMERVRKYPRLRQYFPPHALLHAMAANCAYHRPPYVDQPSKTWLASLMNFYRAYYDPTSEFYLEQKRSPLLWIIYMERHQFWLQEEPNFYDVSRNLILFDDQLYPGSAARMRDRYGFGFREWTMFCLAVYSGLQAKERPEPVIDERFLLDSRSTIGRHPRLPAMFDLLSATSEEVGAAYLELRARKGHLLHDPALPSFFIERPLLRHSKGGYIAVHKPLVFKRGLEGPYDISMAPDHWPMLFGREFGTVFEGYVGDVLGYVPSVRVFNEAQMRQHTDEKICDYLVVGYDFLLLVESKAVKYSATLVSENALKRDNSTTKIAEALDQLRSAAKLIRAGVLTNLIGDTTGKAVLAIVVTFRPIYRANDDIYWEEVLLPKVRMSDESEWQDLFDYRPQVMAVSELERLVLLLEEEAVSPLSVFDEKLGVRAIPPAVVGDWDRFLAQRLGKGKRFPLWADAFKEFFEDARGSFDESGTRFTFKE